MICALVRRLAVLALAIVSCVPSGEETDPRGALGLVTVPSPGSRGEPFVTKDGWTVHVEALIVQVSIVGSTVDPAADTVLGEEVRETSHQGPYLFRASRTESFVAPGLPTGSGTVRLPFSKLEIGTRLTNEPHETEARNVEPTLSARFFQPPESLDPAFDNPGPPDFGPAILLVARAEKNGRVVTIDFTFNGAFRPYDETPLEIRKNALNERRLTTAAENLFSGPTGYWIRCEPNDAGVVKPRIPVLSYADGPVFDDLASADMDGDGKLSAAELRRPIIAPRCDCCSSEDEESVRHFTSSMAELLEVRSAALFLPEREPPGGP